MGTLGCHQNMHYPCIYIGTFTLGGGCSALCLQAGLSIFRSHCANARLHKVEFSNGDQPWGCETRSILGCIRRWEIGNCVGPHWSNPRNQKLYVYSAEFQCPNNCNCNSSTTLLLASNSLSFFGLVNFPKTLNIAQGSGNESGI